MNRLVTIVGPTAVGKSRLALRLAQDFHGEIVGADSRQVYRHLDIGTAKPDRQELSLVPHHLVDIINPDEDFSLAQYQPLACRAIAGIQQRHHLALLVGGSGLYVRAVVEGWGIPPVPPDPEFRHSLEEKAAGGGVDELYQEVVKMDPVAASRIDRRNVRRLIRALEVSRYAEAPFSQLQQKKAPPFDALIIGLTADRAELYRRIDLRVDAMIARGLVEEVSKLVTMGYGFHLPAMSGIGYKQIGRFLRGELTLAAAIQQIKFASHRFVRQQYNWFRLSDSRIQWFDIKNEVEPEITDRVARFIAK
ncbi:MAG: tRNA (adenosine(37)-N6)-dimethylallyltransferase MiaA [Chloroflexi bacterium]|nr:tRNA (adenosine(37)-N6)-dimethylallyltransferase MiaA [Chloroflexota bacterium]